MGMRWPHACCTCRLRLQPVKVCCHARDAATNTFDRINRLSRAWLYNNCCTRSPADWCCCVLLNKCWPCRGHCSSSNDYLFSRTHTSVLVGRAGEGQRQAGPHDVPLFTWPGTLVPRRSRHSSYGSCIATSATFRQPTPAHCASLSTQHMRSSGFSGCWSDGLELTAR